MPLVSSLTRAVPRLAYVQARAIPLARRPFLLKTEPSEDFTRKEGMSFRNRGVFAYVQNCYLRGRSERPLGVPLDIFSVP